jgi:hypothetical protein
LPASPSPRHRQSNTGSTPEKRPSKAESNRLRRVAIREFLSEYIIDKVCVDCGIDDPVALDFHHKPGTEKKFKIADAMRIRVGLNQLRSELEKCEPVCANCHRRRHRSSKWSNVGLDSRFHKGA